MIKHLIILLKLMKKMKLTQDQLNSYQKLVMFQIIKLLPKKCLIILFQ